MKIKITSRIVTCGSHYVSVGQPGPRMERGEGLGLSPEKGLCSEQGFNQHCNYWQASRWRGLYGDKEMEEDWGGIQRESSSKGKAWRLKRRWVIHPLPKFLLYGSEVPSSEPFESHFPIVQWRYFPGSHLWLVKCMHQSFSLEGPKEAGYFLSFHQFLNIVFHKSLFSPM